MRSIVILLLICFAYPAFAQWEESGLRLDSLKYKKPIKERRTISKTYRRTGHLTYNVRSTSHYDREGKMTESNTVIKYYPYNQLIKGDRQPSTTFKHETYHYRNNYLERKITSERTKPGAVFKTELYNYENNKLVLVKGFTSSDSSLAPGSEESFSISFEYYTNGKRKNRIYLDSVDRDVTEYTYDSLGRFKEVITNYFTDDTLKRSHKAIYRYTENRQIITGITTSRSGREMRSMTDCKFKNGRAVKRKDWSERTRYMTRNKYTSWGALKKSVKRDRGMVRNKYKVHFTYY